MTAKKAPIERMVDNVVELVITDPPSGKRGMSDSGLPEDCPVEPLGIDGDMCFYLDANRQLRALASREHSRLGVQKLFGPEIQRLYDYWPKLKEDPDEKTFKTVGWQPALASEALMSAAAARGVWRGLEKVRGTGAWTDQGRLVLHCGDTIITAEGEAGPGRIGDFVYPAGPRGPKPIKGQAGARAAEDLFSLLKTWNWRRGAIDARLLLGWIGAAWLGGALKWRPVAWVTGGRGTGKSTLQDLLKLLFAGALVPVSDASAAGIWQRLGYSTWPVAVDEMEADQDNRQAQAVIKLARQAASGGLVLRGGQDHQSVEFVARSCFLFSSILLPPLLGQDRSRMAILELDELSRRAAPRLDGAEMRAMGCQLLRRLIDGWPRLAPTLEFYHAVLGQLGHNARSTDVFGTLLACADLMLSDALPCADDVAPWIDHFDIKKLEEWTDDESDETRCLAHLLTSPIDPFRNGARHVIAEWVVKASRHGADYANDREEANRVLGTYGLKVTGEFLAVANYHQQLSVLFLHTHWAGRSGSQGVWVQALRRLPGGRRATGALRFAAATARATLLPLRNILPLEIDTRAGDDMAGFAGREEMA